MRKYYLLIALAVLIQACAGVPLSFLTPSTPVPTFTATITFTPTITRTPTITPSVTPSATIVHIPTEDPNLPGPTPIQIPVFTGNGTYVPAGSPTPTKPGPGFLSLTLSENKIYWGVCDPNKTKIVVQVEDPKEVTSVIIFVQVKSAKEEDYTPWTTGDAMQGHRDGTFSYTLGANHIYGRNHYLHSWVFLQMVATNDKGEEVGRTRVFRDIIALSPCM